MRIAFVVGFAIGVAWVACRDADSLCQRVIEPSPGAWMVLNEYVPCDSTIPVPDGPCWDADGDGSCRESAGEE